MSALDALTPLPPDALLGLMTAFRADPRAEKYDLGVGVFKDAAGETPVLRAVKTAEARLVAAQTTKVYEGPRGNLDFCGHIENFVFGAAHPAHSEHRTLSFTAAGGCGALFLGVGLMRRLGAARVWISKPTWPNHPNVIASLGLTAGHYTYVKDGAFDRAGAFADLANAAPGDGVILQGPCHNPTGIDLDLDDWRAAGELAREKRLLVMIDLAYHGFAHGLEADMAGVRVFLEASGEAMIAYSCSKNFGLYRERTGCFLMLGQSASGIAAATTHIADMARASWSMPPAHGAGIVATILGDAALRADWEIELASMRDRMISLRAALADALVAATGSNALGCLKAQHGMFSQLPLTAQQAAELREAHGVYIPASGRINIAGLNAGQIPALAEILSGYL